MTTPIDPRDLIDQADDLLDDINQANVAFADKTNKITANINKSFKAIDKISQELDRAENEAIEQMDGQILDYLAKSQE
ncbi:MAG: hypothetical protein Q7K65_03790 [Candidatus Buchananbacteria bacterium]|nr:hypothetical protein [Candidatus Buchananbacteria bacterium]